MTPSILDDPRFRDRSMARLHLALIRWPNGPVCPHCHAINPVSKLRRPRIYCRECRSQFTVTAGTVFENTKIPLQKWILAAAVLAAGEKPTPIRQLQRILGVAYATAWSISSSLRATTSLRAPRGQTLKCVDEILLRMLSTRPRFSPQSIASATRLKRLSAEANKSPLGSGESGDIRV